MKIERCSPVSGRYCAGFRGAVEARQPPRPVPSRTFGGAGRRHRLRRWSARGRRRGSRVCEWSGSTIEYHRAQVRDHLGYRVATVADQERLPVWLSEAVAHAERRPDRVREELLAEFRRLRIEPPTPGRLVRMVRSALRTAEQNWASRIAGRLNPSATARLLSLIAHRGIRSVKP